MNYDRFDWALLSLFDMKQLASPFAVTQVDTDKWFVTQDGKLVGQVRRIHAVCYTADRVMFIPA